MYDYLMIPVNSAVDKDLFKVKGRFIVPVLKRSGEPLGSHLAELTALELFGDRNEAEPDVGLNQFLAEPEHNPVSGPDGADWAVVNGQENLQIIFRTLTWCISLREEPLQFIAPWQHPELH